MEKAGGPCLEFALDGYVCGVEYVFFITHDGI